MTNEFFHNADTNQRERLAGGKRMPCKMRPIRIYEDTEGAKLKDDKFTEANIEALEKLFSDTVTIEEI